jgi:myo-inositol-1(or 4)-monophosphatase
MIEELDRRLSIAEAAAREAGIVARDEFANLDTISIEKKGLQDWVSAADREVEKLIKARLLAAFPEDGFLGEEFGGAEKDGVWVVDPIDGTGNFVRGIPLFGISIAYWYRGEPLVGVIYDPINEELYAARKGGGATKNGKSIRVREVEGLQDAVIGVGFSTKGSKEQLIEAMRAFLLGGAEFRRLGAAVLCLAWVAEGRLDAFWHTSLNAWDALAGVVIVREAGGRANRAFGVGELLDRAPTLVAAPGIAPIVAQITNVEVSGNP